jgi:hypothetical protein
LPIADDPLARTSAERQFGDLDAGVRVDAKESRTLKADVQLMA